MKFQIIQKAVFPFLLVTLIVSGCRRSGGLEPGKEWYCNAETLTRNGKQFTGTGDTLVLFNGGKLQDSTTAHSGKYSAITYPGKAFAFGIKQPAGPDWYYKVSVWRKSPNGKGVLVATTKDSKRFYKAVSTPVEKDKNGWEKLEM